jgi:curved DNA-binding protein
MAPSQPFNVELTAMADLVRMTRSGPMTAGQARELLGLPVSADAAALGHAYRLAVKAAHPDLGGDPERLLRVIEAHRLLKSLGEARLAFAPATRPRTAPEPEPQTFSLGISLREAIVGGRRKLTVAGGRTLNLRLPKGLRVGETLRLKGLGDGGGDILVQVDIQAGPKVTIRGDDLWLEVSASPSQLKPGKRLEIDTPRGRRAVVAPEGAAEGRAVRLRGQGLPARGKRPAGDLILKLQIRAEESASKKLLRRFAARWAA